MGREIWQEFKSTVMPWMLAAAVVALFLVEQHRGDRARGQEVEQLRATVQEQTQAIEGFKSLLAEQGYVAPPLVAAR